MIHRCRLMALLVAGLIGCDDAPAPLPPPQAPPRSVTIDSVTPLAPGRATHLVADGLGQVLWSQEAEDASGEVVFSLAEGSLPQATGFGTAAILKTLEQSGASGSIQSLCIGADGRLYFFFTGGKKKQMLAAFGCFAAGEKQVKILADSSALMKTSGLGQSLSLARGTLVRSGSLVWLWLRHSDDFSLLNYDTDRIGTPLRRPFEKLITAPRPPRLTSPTDDLSAAESGSVLWLDRASGQLWKIAPLGEAAEIATLADLPRNCTMPILDDRGRVVLFAPDGPAFIPATQNPIAAASTSTQYPALIFLDGPRREIFPRDTFRAPATTKVPELAPGTMIRDRSTLLIYNTPTGELMRLKVEGK